MTTVRTRCSRHGQVLDGSCIRCHEEAQARDRYERIGRYETQERIAGPLVMAATGEPVKLLDVLEQGVPTWRKGTVVAVEYEDWDGGKRPIYTLQWQVVGDVPADVMRLR